MDKPLQQQQDTIRLPVYTDEQSRAFAGFDAYSEQAYVNCFPIIEKNAITGETNVSLIKRGGTAVSNTLSPTIGSYGTRDDMLCLENKCITQLYDVYIAAFFDSNNSKIYILQYRPVSQTTVKIGEIATCTADDLIFVTEMTDGDTQLPGISISYQKADRSSGTGYYAVTTAGVFTTSSLTTISHASFPANLGTPKIITGPFQYMNGHNYIMTLDGFIYMSSLTAAGNSDISTWNTLATVVASQSPDKGMGVFRYKNFLLAFGQSSIEFFVDASDPPPGSTLERTDQAYIKFGCYTPKAVRIIDDTIYWISYSDSNTVGVYKMSGFAPVKISTTREDAFIAQFFQGNTQKVGYFSLETVYISNRTHLIINGPNYLTLAPLIGVIDTLSNAGGDTFETDTFDEGKANILAYNIIDNVWWGLAVGDPALGTPAYVRSTGTFPATTQAGAYAQWCFFSLSTSTGQDGTSSTRPRRFLTNTGGTDSYVDVNTDGTTPVPIAMAFQLNAYWFQVEKRKRISRLKFITDGLGLDIGAANVYALYPYWVKDQTLSTAQTRRVVLPSVSQRYYVNNLGMFRSLQIGCFCKSEVAMTVRAIEVDISQGT